MSKVIVVGGGASGLVAAIYAAKNHNKVILLERNPSCCKKILITGNGKCNYFNENQDIHNYHSSNINVVEKIITKNNIEEILSFFDSIGIIPRIKNGYYYPYSSLAASVKEALLKEAKLLKIEIKTNFLVQKIEREKNGFIVSTEGEKIFSDVLVLATGSMACPKTGSTGDGYNFLKYFGHNIIPVLPALTQLKGSESYFKEWSGIRTDASIKLYVDDVFLEEEVGEIQLTESGISGICVFNLSSLVARGLSLEKKVYVTINFVPWLGLSNEECIHWIDNRNRKVRSRTIVELLEGFLNYKLVGVLLKKSHILPTTYWDKLSIEEKRQLVQNLTVFYLDITGTSSFDKAQVCSGGVSLMEVNSSTLESKKVSNLYITGELLDIDGKCGGYNLTAAWITGMLVGKSIK